ncbi:13466_t:CDS:10, partial [Dentiscutata heterogama]
IQNLSLQFEGWEFALSPDQFNLVSILKFRRMKDDFTYKKSVEHAEIFKFVLYIAETATDKKWKEVASALKENEMIKRQTQWEEVKLFWNIVENEKVDLDERLLKKKLEQAKTQFIVDRYVSGNEAHVIADKAKLDYMLALDSPSVLTIPPSDTSFKTPPLDTFLTTPPPNTSLTTPGNKANTVLNENQKDKPITGSKRKYPNEESTLSTPSTPPNKHASPPESWIRSKEKSNSGNIFPNILPNGTILQEPPPAPDFISLYDDEDDNPLMVENDNDEDIPTLDNVLCSSLPTNIQNWNLSSGKLVNDIFAKNLSQHTEMLKNKKKLTAEEKATLRYGVSRVIDLSAHMRVWFTETERQDMMKDHEEILKVPELTKDINEFIAKVEKMIKEGDANGAYKYCLNQHADASVNTCFYKISKIYGDFLYNVKDGNDLLYCGGEHHTEIDVIVKTCSYIVNGLQNGTEIHCKCQSANYERGRKCDVRFLSHTGIDLGEWEFSAQATPTKAIEDRCRSARINQSILNGLLSRDLTDAQTGIIKVPYLQIAGVFGQLLVEDLVNGFYVVYPGPIFEIPTRLNHIRKLKSVIISFKHIMEMYKEVNEILAELNHSRNLLEDIFKVDGVRSLRHNSYKSVFIHKPWWTPKSKSQKSQSEKGTNEVQIVDDSDCSHDNDSEEERLDESDDDGYNGYDRYDEYGGCDRGYYYRDRRYERKSSPMMSPIILPP